MINSNDQLIQYSNWFTLLLLCTSAPLVLYCDRFDRGSRQVKRELVDLLMEDYDVSLFQRVGIHNYYTKDHIITCDRCNLGSSILLYVESFGDRLLLMRTHEDLSSDVELLVYVFYDFVVILETLRFLTFRFTHTQTSALASNRSCWQKHKRVHYKIMEIETKTILNVKTLLMFV